MNEVEPKALVVRPDWSDQACRWGSAQMERKSLKYFLDSIFQIKDLHASDATKAQIFANWLECNYAEILGHGSPTAYTAQKQEIVFQVGNTETETLAKQSKTMGVNFISCQVAQTLVPYLINLGLRCAVACDEDMVFLIDGRQFPNGKAEPFWECFCAVSKSVSKGTTLYDAYLYEMQRWEYNIDHADARTKQYLVQNYNHRGFYGDKKFNPSKPHVPDPVPDPEPTPEPTHYKFKLSGKRSNTFWQDGINGDKEIEGDIILEPIPDN